MSKTPATPYESILYAVESGGARITLNRPDKRNALSEALLRELSEALWEADNDNRVHAAIIQANGPDFSSGYDLGHYEGPEPENAGHRRGKASLDDDIWRLERSRRNVPCWPAPARDGSSDPRPEQTGELVDAAREQVEHRGRIEAQDDGWGRFHAPSWRYGWVKRDKDKDRALRFKTIIEQ